MECGDTKDGITGCGICQKVGAYLKCFGCLDKSMVIKDGTCTSVVEG